MDKFTKEVMKEVANAYQWDNQHDWQPPECPICKSKNLDRVSVQTCQGDGGDSWICKDCGKLIVRKEKYIPPESEKP